MKNPQQHPLYVATHRLVDALDRLEYNLQYITVTQDRSQQQEKQLIIFERKNGELLQEKQQQDTAIAELQVQYDVLHKTASVVHKRLEDSIKRLTQIIEE